MKTNSVNTDWNRHGKNGSNEGSEHMFLLLYLKSYPKRILFYAYFLLYVSSAFSEDVQKLSWEKIEQILREHTRI